MIDKVQYNHYWVLIDILISIGLDNSEFKTSCVTSKGIDDLKGIITPGLSGTI